MEKEDQRKLIKYWQETADHDYETMEALFHVKRYDSTLFFGHIVLEKILKSLVAKYTGEHAPYTHNLVRLAEKTSLNFSEEEMELFREVNSFNIEARYPEERLEFYRQCTQAYAAPYVEKIKTLYQKLCQQSRRKE